MKSGGNAMMVLTTTMEWLKDSDIFKVVNGSFVFKPRIASGAIYI